MAKKSAHQSVVDSFIKGAPILYILVRPVGVYRTDRRWGIFDTLGVRVIDDLTFSQDSGERSIAVFTEKPPYAGDVVCVEMPTQVALERIFFHVQGISNIFINPRVEVAGGPSQQAGIGYAIPENFAAAQRILRSEIPEYVGAFFLPKRKIANLLERAERAFKANSLFEALCLARQVQRLGGSEARRASFIELMALSFMGLPEESLARYEAYLSEVSSEPEAQLIGARFRALLKQFNEARTILHTLSFNDDIGAIATCELARSYAASGEFDRAVDLATSAINKDPNYIEAYLVRGVAQRGISYPVGDEDGLREALKDLEKVAQAGGFGAPEALFHAGTIFGRLGAFEQAEIALRQSLFQRDRYASRDALVRVLCALQKYQVAEDELAAICALAPGDQLALKRDIEAHLANARSHVKPEEQEKLWSAEDAAALKRAAEAIAKWNIPLTGDLQDFRLLDDFINRFAPAGEFINIGLYAHLHNLNVAEIVRALSLHLGAILIRNGVATGSVVESDKIVLISKRGFRLPLESFLHERLTLGASGDNLTSLESIVAEDFNQLSLQESASKLQQMWWQKASEAELANYHAQAELARGVLAKLGAPLRDKLEDLWELDAIIDRSFEPGGEVQEPAKSIIGQDVEPFVVGLGFIIGELISELLTATWCSHEVIEGVSLEVEGLGRLFPIAVMQRRVYLASAIDPSAKLASIGYGVATAVIAQRIKAGVYKDLPHIITAFRDLVPHMQEFSESEIEAVVDSLLGR